MIARKDSLRQAPARGILGHDLFRGLRFGDTTNLAWVLATRGAQRRYSGFSRT